MHLEPPAAITLTHLQLLQNLRLTTFLSLPESEQAKTIESACHAIRDKSRHDAKARTDALQLATYLRVFVNQNLPANLHDQITAALTDWDIPPMGKELATSYA